MPLTTQRGINRSTRWIVRVTPRKRTMVDTKRPAPAIWLAGIPERRAIAKIKRII